MIFAEKKKWPSSMVWRAVSAFMPGGLMRRGVHGHPQRDVSVKLWAAVKDWFAGSRADRTVVASATDLTGLLTSGNFGKALLINCTVSCRLSLSARLDRLEVPSMTKA